MESSDKQALTDPMTGEMGHSQFFKRAKALLKSDCESFAVVALDNDMDHSYLPKWGRISLDNNFKEDPCHEQKAYRKRIQ